MLFGKNQLKDIKEGFSYILKSERLKALILSSALIGAMLSFLSSYYLSLLENLRMSSIIIGIVTALVTFTCSYASKKQEVFHKKLRNKALITIALMISITTIISGICGLKAQEYTILILIIILMNIIKGFGHGMYHTIVDKYLRNFANEKIDTKIFAAKNLVLGITGVIVGLFASFLLDKTITAYAMIIMGIIFTIIYILMGIYMKSRVGLKPEEYSKEETKYDDQHQY